MSSLLSHPGSTVRFKGATLQVVPKHQQIAQKLVELTLIDGEWPEENDLITIADGYEDFQQRHFGGEVRYQGRKAHVLVYTD